MATDKTAGIEASAISILKRAVELDNNKRFEEALTCYQEGVGLLMQVLKSVSQAAKKQRYREKIEQYLKRAEELKVYVKEETEASKQHEQIRIEENSTGHSYDSLFGHHLTKFVTEIEVEDPYIRLHHQVLNFLRFCELIVKKKIPVKRILLITGKDDSLENQEQQHSKLLTISKSLITYGIRLDILYSDTLHDREIRLNTGWVIKIGRGLDMYKNCNKFSIGASDFDLRPCQETTVDIFHRKAVKGQAQDN